MNTDGKKATTASTVSAAAATGGGVVDSGFRKEFSHELCFNFDLNLNFIKQFFVLVTI
jgi:hypothetical protein